MMASAHSNMSLAFSAQCPVPWPCGSQLEASLPIPSGMAEGQVRGPWSHGHSLIITVISAMLGMLSLREPPPPGLDCPLAYPKAQGPASYALPFRWGGQGVARVEPRASLFPASGISSSWQGQRGSKGY